MSRRRVFLLILAGTAVLFLAIQLVPYGRDHSNPAVVSTPPWDARTAELARTACLDCHSNETRWPWYSNVAPVSWLVQRDVDTGRSIVNFSEWGTSGAGEEAGEGELAEAVREGEMPPWFYPLMHSDARLTDQERTELAAGLARIQAGGGG